MTYEDFGRKASQRVSALLSLEGPLFPSSYADYMSLDCQLRNMIARYLYPVLSDNYEHFMAVLPHKKFAAQHVLIRQQIGGFTVAAGYWKWLEFLSHQLTKAEVELLADFYSGKHNGFPRQFDRDYWMHVVDDYNGYAPLIIRIPTAGEHGRGLELAGEGVTFTGVPFPLAEVYGETPAVWANEPMYIQTGHLTHVATIAAQFAELTGDPWRFIEVAFRALHNAEESPDFLLAMLIGGGIISTSNDLGAFINGAPFKSTGTTGHCWYQQFPTMLEALRTLLSHPLGKFSTVLLDLVDHQQGFRELVHLIEKEKLTPPFAERPDTGDVEELALHDMLYLQDRGCKIKSVLEDSRKPANVMHAEMMRRQFGLEKERMLHGAGSAFIGPRSTQETAYKACHFHDGTFEHPTDAIDTAKLAKGNVMKGGSFAGRVDWFYNPETGFMTIGRMGEPVPSGCQRASGILYDGLTHPGKPYFNSAYNPNTLAACLAVQAGKDFSKNVRTLLGPNFTQDVTPNKTRIRMTLELRKKREEVELRNAEQSGLE